MGRPKVVSQFDEGPLIARSGHTAARRYRLFRGVILNPSAGFPVRRQSPVSACGGFCPPLQRLTARDRPAPLPSRPQNPPDRRGLCERGKGVEGKRQSRRGCPHQRARRRSRSRKETGGVMSRCSKNRKQSLNHSTNRSACLPVPMGNCFVFHRFPTPFLAMTLPAL